MCCRYYMEMSPKLRPIVEAAQRSGLYRASIEKVAKPLITEGEVFPDSLVPVIATGKSGKRVFSRTKYPPGGLVLHHAA